MLKTRLLNKMVKIYNVTQTINGSGDGSNTEILVGEIPMRITNNKPSNIYGKDYGVAVSSTNIGYCNPSILVDIKIGNFLVDGTDKYKVNFVDKTPGGESNHHWEILMTLVE